MADDLEKKRKNTFSFLRLIGMDKNKNKPDPNVFYGGNVVTAAKNRDKEIKKVAGK